MLTYILAIAVGFGSFALYLAAFFFPEMHRRSDFLWSGVGMFYALVLWVCAGRITGGVLLGQCASVALLGWLGWQTLTLRRELTPAALRTQPLPQSSWQSQWQQWQTNLTQRSQPPSLSSGLATLSARFTTIISTAVALMQGLWETSRKSFQKPEKPSRPTIVRSPSKKRERPFKPEQAIKTEELVNPQEAMPSSATDGVVVEENLATPNQSLEPLEDDFFAEDTNSPSIPDSPEAVEASDIPEAVDRATPDLEHEISNVILNGATTTETAFPPGEQ